MRAAVIWLCGMRGKGRLDGGSEDCWGDEKQVGRGEQRREDEGHSPFPADSLLLSAPVIEHARSQRDENRGKNQGVDNQVESVQKTKHVASSNAGIGRAMVDDDGKQACDLQSHAAGEDGRLLVFIRQASMAEANAI